jgi:hypothetical protein
MSWAGLADNQIVSFNNLIDAVNTGQFTALTTIPASNEEITKTDASTYVDCWTGYSLFANKASNQLIAKRDLVTTTSTTSTTTAPPTSTTSTTTSSTTLFTNLFFDATTSACGYYITAIDVNSVVPTLTGGTDVPFCTDGHSYNTTQTGTNETLNLTVGSLSLNGCITVTDSAFNTYSQNIPSNGVYSFTGLVIDNTTTVQIIIADNFC